MAFHQIALDAHPEWREFFAQAEELTQGERLRVGSQLRGIRGKRELLGFRSWIAAERRRRKAEVANAMLANPNIPNEAIESADPLRGITTSIWEVGDHWMMEIAKASWHLVEKFSADGTRTVLWDENGPEVEMESEPQSIPGGGDQ